MLWSKQIFFIKTIQATKLFSIPQFDHSHLFLELHQIKYPQKRLEGMKLWKKFGFLQDRFWLAFVSYRFRIYTVIRYFSYILFIRYLEITLTSMGYHLVTTHSYGLSRFVYVYLLRATLLFSQLTFQKYIFSYTPLAWPLSVTLHLN